MWHPTGAGAEHQIRECSSWAALPWPLTHREGSSLCSLEFCYLWLSVVSGQLVLGLHIHGVAAREVTAGLLIHSECQKYLLASSSLFIAVSESVSEGLLQFECFQGPLWEQQQQQLSLLSLKHHGHSTAAVTAVTECVCPSWETQSILLFLTVGVHEHFPCESATSQLQPSLKSGASCFLLLGPSGSHWKLD